MVSYRWATRNDIEPLIDLIEKGFSINSDSVVDRKQGKEHRVLFSYLYSREEWDPEWVYLTEESSRLLAAVGFFPQRLFFEGVEIPIWAVSPVVTDPDYRGKGYAGTCLIRAMEDLKGRGIPGVFLWGLPDYYPRFGFVPTLPRYKTKLILGKPMVKEEIYGRFRNVGFGDLSKIASIYDSGNLKYWLQPKRELKWWEERYKEIDIYEGIHKEVPFPKKENFLVWENNRGEIKGYLNYLKESDQTIIINESSVIEADNALEMIKSLRFDLFPEKKIYIRGTPDHTLNAAVYRLGGTHINPAPLAGMVRIIDWRQFVKYLLPIVNNRTRLLTDIRDGDVLELGSFSQKLNWVWHDTVGWEIDPNIGLPQNRGQEIFLTKLIFGLYDQIDLSQFCSKCLETIQHLFPKKYPFIWDNNYLY